MPDSNVRITSGNQKCYHGIDTDDVNEWNEHCSDPANNHTDSGTCNCIQCGCSMIFIDIPYQPIDASGSKNIHLRCDECEDSMRQSYRNKSLRKIENPKQGITMPEPYSQQNSSSPKRSRGKELE